MANTAHLFRRQSSRDFNGSHRDYTKTLDEVELKVSHKNCKLNFCKTFCILHFYLVMKCILLNRYDQEHGLIMQKNSHEAVCSS